MRRLIFVMVIVLSMMVTACEGATVPKPTTVVEQPTDIEPEDSVEPTLVASPQPAKPEATQAQYAPFCAADPNGCESPAVKLLDKAYCVDRVPYAIISVPAGTTYESLDSDMKCVDQMHNDGDLRITCHSVTSKQLWAYDIKVCNGACAAPDLQMETGQCPEGYGYDATNMCCAAPAPSGSDGCTIYRVELGICRGQD